MVETVSDSGNTSNLMQQIVKANQSALSAINEIGKNAVQISVVFHSYVVRLLAALHL
jgi:hypothetical protein